MNQLICHRCGKHEFTAVEFRNTRHVRITVGSEMISLICTNCHLVVWNVEGRADASCLLKKSSKTIRTYLNLRR
jgi:ribosomal protein L37E